MCPVRIHRVGVVHADDARPRHSDVLGILGHDQRHVDVERVGPRHAGDVHIVSVIYIISVVPPVGRLPQNGSAVEVQLYVALQPDLSGNVASSVSAVIPPQHHSSAASSAASVDGPVDGLRVVRESIAFGPVVADVKVTSGQAEGIGITAKVLPVFHVEARSHLHHFPLFVANDGQHAAAQQRDIPHTTAVWNMADGELLSRRTSVKARKALQVGHLHAARLDLLRAERWLGEFLHGADGCAVEVHRSLVNLEDGEATSQFGGDVSFHPYVLRACRAAVDASGKVLDGLFFLEVDAMEEESAIRGSDGFEAKARQLPVCCGQVAQVGIIRASACLRLNVDNLACFPRKVLLALGEERDTHLAGIASVLQHHEYGVIDLQRRVVDAVATALQCRGRQCIVSLKVKAQCIVLVLYCALPCLKGICAARQLELEIEWASGHHFVKAQLAVLPYLVRSVLDLNGHIGDAVTERAVADVQNHCLPQRRDNLRPVGAGVPVTRQCEARIHLPSRACRCHMQAEQHQVAVAQVERLGKIACDAPPARSRHRAYVEQGCLVRLIRLADATPGCGPPSLCAFLKVL